MVKILMIDNYDSFTYNLIHYMEDNQLGATIDVKHPHELRHFHKKKYDGFVISPGPSHPKDRQDVIRFIRDVWTSHPILGVCLGQQMLWYMTGGTVTRGQRPIHGHVYSINHTSNGLFKNIPSPFQVTRYHSLECIGQNAEFKIVGKTDDGINMAIEHRSLPIYGMQYHPEAILSEYGREQLHQFIVIVKEVSR